MLLAYDKADGNLAEARALAKRHSLVLPDDLDDKVCVLAGGQTHGVLLMNSNGMDIVITDSKISYRMIGGVADFYFFLGPTPNAVLEQLTSMVGRPMMAPYWSLGLMNSK